MKEIILHIGHGKTGSSYLQSCLSLNRNKLLDLGIDYPADGSFQDAINGKITSGNFSKFKDLYLTNKIITYSKCLLFSSEAIFFLIENDSKLIKFLEINADKLKIILYTRNLFSYEFSGWGQLVKRHHLFEDIDSFLVRSKNLIYPTLLKWIELTNKYGIELIIKNYSNHKDNLLNTFLKDSIGEKVKNIEFSLPKNKQINRSLTFSEYEVQRICNYLNKRGTKNFLSDNLVNNFPNIKAMNIKCNMETYNILKNKNLEIINNINCQIDKNESIKIEPMEEVVIKENDIQKSSLTIKQIKLISSHLKENILIQKNLDPKFVDQIRDIAVKIANKESINLSDALSLMKIAQLFRKDGPFINSTVEKWEAELNKNGHH